MLWLLLGSFAHGAEPDSVTFTRLIVRDDSGAVIGQVDDSYRVLILEKLRASGIGTKGAEDLLFGRDESASARFLLGGTVTSTICLGNRCEVAIEWQVFDTRAESVVYQVVTRGVSDRYPRTSDVGHLTVGQAVTSLAARSGFLETLQPKDVREPDLPTWSAPLTLKSCELPPHPIPAEVDGFLESNVVIHAGNFVGSGVVVSPDGFVLTAAHVVPAGEAIRVRFRSGLELPATAIRTDFEQDIAIIDIAGSGFGCAPIATEVPAIGSELFAVGAPLGDDLAFSVSKGVVSGIRDVDGWRLVQTDAAVNHGNSGGPLVDGSGTVVAIVSRKIEADGLEGLAFGVPTMLVADRLGVAFGTESDPDPVARSGTRGGASPAAALRVDAEEPSTLVPTRPPTTRLVDPPPADEPATPRVRHDYRPALRIGGLVLTGVSVAGVITTWQGAKLDGTTLDTWRTLRTVNTLAWIGLGSGGGVTAVGFSLEKPE